MKTKIIGLIIGAALMVGCSDISTKNRDVVFEGQILGAYTVVKSFTYNGQEFLVAGRSNGVSIIQINK